VEEGWECHDGWSCVLISIVLYFEEVFGRGVSVVGRFVEEIKTGWVTKTEVVCIVWGGSICGDVGTLELREAVLTQPDQTVVVIMNSQII